MISPDKFVLFLERSGYRHFTGVPCSYFKNVIQFIESQKSLRYWIAPNEGSALAVASGVHLGGESCAVIIQNSGLGNLINPLVSLNAIYNIPVPIFVSGRAYGISDEPQHEIMGAHMSRLLDSLGIRYWDLPQDDSVFESVLKAGFQEMAKTKKPVVFLVRKGTFASCVSDKKKETYELKRIDAISMIQEFLSEDDLVLTTTGKPSRELFTIGDRPGNFYMQGSMGHVGSIAFGTSVVRPQQRIVVIDGDGAFLMHMGTASMIGHYPSKNFYHIVLDNEAYETTGNQDTTSRTTDFELIAKACGYHATWRVEDAESLRSALPLMLQTEGPVLLHVKINRLSTKDIPRITTRYSSPQIKENFTHFILNQKSKSTF